MMLCDWLLSTKKILMDVFKQECKLCEDVVSDRNFKAIGEVAKSIFDILSLKLTLDDDTLNVVCTICSTKLLAALNFKSTCLCTDNTIIPYLDFENPKPVDLKEIYAKEKGNEQDGVMLDDLEICRLCFQPMSGDHKSKQEAPVDSFEIYIPEINFAATTNPTFCLKCHDALLVHSTFIKNCWEVEEKRNRDAMDIGDMILTNPCIKTEEIDIKSDETDEAHFEILCNTEKEENKEGDTFLHPQTGLISQETKSHDAPNDLTVSHYKTTSESERVGRELRHKRNSEIHVNQNKNDCGSRKTQRRSTTKGFYARKYKCDKCVFKANRKDSFKRHQLIHKDPSEVQMYECDKCKYKSKLKFSLVAHQLTHKDRSQMQMYACNECDIQYTTKKSLKRHQLTHSDPSRVQTFVCDECDYKCVRKDLLKQHKLKHKDPMYRCNECDYRGFLKGDFNRHLLKHRDRSNVQTFKCDKCDYRSILKGSLKVHLMVHQDPSDVQMYKCDKCKFLTKYKTYLRKHCSRHKCQ